MPISSIIFAQNNDNVFTEDFADITEWETVVGNHYQGIDSTTMGTVAKVNTFDDGNGERTVLFPTVTKNKNRMSAITKVKKENWITDKRVKTVTATAYLGSAYSNANTIPGVYAVHINDYKSLGLCVYYHSTKNAVYYQWFEFNYSATQTGTNIANNTLFSQSTAKATDLTTFEDWITISLSYDYSKITDNQLVINATLSDGGETYEVPSYTLNFDDTEYSVDVKYNAYKEGFDVGISNRTSNNHIYYYDFFSVEFDEEKTGEDTSSNNSSSSSSSGNSSSESGEGEIPDEDLSLQAPNIIINPAEQIDEHPEYSEYLDGNRLWQGIPSVAKDDESGRLWYAFYSGGETENEYNWSVLYTSDDDGATWSGPKVVVDPEFPVRSFDPNVWLDPDGRLWFFWAQSYYKYDGRAGVWAMFTENPEDENPVWSTPKRIAHGVAMNDPIVLTEKSGELEAGTWILPTAVWKRSTTHSDLLDIARASCYVSTDKGATWKYQGNVKEYTGNDSYEENMIIEQKDGNGTLRQLIRTQTGIEESYSTDGGKTWTNGVDAQLTATQSRFYIGWLDDATQLLVYNNPPTNTNTRSHLTAAISVDGGKTWDNSLIIDERTSTTYPDAHIDSQGNIYISYDHGRTEKGEMMLAKIKKADILAGEIVSDGSYLKKIVNNNTVYPQDKFRNDYKDILSLTVDTVTVANAEKIGKALNEYYAFDTNIKNNLANEYELLLVLDEKILDIVIKNFKEEYSYELSLSESTITKSDGEKLEEALNQYLNFSSSVKNKLSNEYDILKKLNKAVISLGYVEEFNNLNKWETKLGNYRVSQNVSITNEANIIDFEDKKVLTPVVSGNSHASMITTFKEDFWPENSVLKTLSVKFKIPTSDATNPDRCAGIYAVSVNEYKSLVLQLNRSADTGYLNYQWRHFYYDETQSTGCNGTIICDVNGSTRKTSKILKTDGWITATISYDYSQIAENKLIVNCVFSDEYGNNETTGFVMPFTDSGTNAYNENFTVGIGSTNKGATSLQTYFDTFEVEFDGASSIETKPYVKGATIKKSGTQDIQFTYCTGEIKKDNPIIEYGMLLTLKNLNIDDLTLENINDILSEKIKTKAIKNVSIYEPTMFVATIGEISEELYTYRYQTRVYVKYQDGTVQYSDIIEKSVSGISKSIGKWVLDNENKIDGLVGDITQLVNTDGTLTEFGKANNGREILAFLSNNAATISSAIKTLGQ